jgi:hypothetical protein
MPVMKKLLLTAGLLLAMIGSNFAQQPADKDKKKDAATSAAHTKKDGTPDKRYKENKGGTAAAATTHVKKDGTPDKRYKENKKKG